MTDEMSSYEHGFSEGVEQQIKIHQRLKCDLQSQLKESQDRAELISKALESANESVKEWETTAKGWMLSCEKAQARVKVLEEALEYIQSCDLSKYELGFDYGEDHKRLGKAKAGARWLTPQERARAALKDGEK